MVRPVRRRIPERNPSGIISSPHSSGYRTRACHAAPACVLGGSVRGLGPSPACQAWSTAPKRSADPFPSNRLALATPTRRGRVRRFGHAHRRSALGLGRPGRGRQPAALCESREARLCSSRSPCQWRAPCVAVGIHFRRALGEIRLRGKKVPTERWPLGRTRSRGSRALARSPAGSASPVLWVGCSLWRRFGGRVGCPRSQAQRGLFS